MLITFDHIQLLYANAIQKLVEYFVAYKRKERLEKTFLKCYFALFALQCQSTFITLQSPFLVSTSILISKSLRLTSSSMIYV